MSDTRTPEQRAADDALEEAIKARDRAYDGRAGILMEYVVVSAWAMFVDDNEVTMIDYSGGAGQPVHRTFGLLSWAFEKYRATYIDGGRNQIE